LAAVAGTQPSSAISWQPLQMPRLKLSGLQAARREEKQPSETHVCGQRIVQM
jgi:hypothetical protein